MKCDIDLQRDVVAELKWEPSVNAAHIGVTVEDGVVTLTGHVPSYGEKHAAEKSAKRVYGVRAVANELSVNLPGDSNRTDEDIALTCANSLKAHHLVPEQRIRVVINNGWVTLEGDVESQRQREAVMNTVRYVTGVRGACNDIQIRPHASPSDVKSKIEAAFKRSAEIDARRISVEAHDGKVILYGRVSTWAEHEEAQQAAWAAPGVTAVENHIMVTP